MLTSTQIATTAKATVTVVLVTLLAGCADGPLRKTFSSKDRPPATAEKASVAPDKPSTQIFVYPKNHQSEDQQVRDKFECSRWATTQTGFDPTQPDGGALAAQSSKRADYRRAMVACLDGRDYSVQ